MKPKFRDVKGTALTPLLSDYITEMIEIGSIVPTSKKIFQSRHFPAAKKGTTKKRIVLDMTRLNKFIPCKKFRMTTTCSVHCVIEGTCR